MNLSLDELRTVQTLYEKSRAECGPGFCWHVVLDDGNYQDLTTLLCAEWAIESEGREPGKHRACCDLGRWLLRMSTTQRKKLSCGGYKHLVERGSP